MGNVKTRLDAWRAAERRRDVFAQGSAEWFEADAEVQVAEALYHAEFAQASARFSELEVEDRDPRRLVDPERRTSARGD